jgi:hypothetical protein
MAPAAAAAITNWDNFFFLVVGFVIAVAILGFVPWLGGIPSVPLPVLRRSFRTKRSFGECRDGIRSAKTTEQWRGVMWDRFFLFAGNGTAMTLVGTITPREDDVSIKIRIGIPFGVIGMLFFILLFMASDGVRVVLEDPFPRRQLVVAYPGGSFVLQDAGDRYLRGEPMYGLAMVTDGTASSLLRQWLPTPAIARDDPAVLFTAEKVTLPDQDITRWKASIVRGLLAPSRGDKSSWDDQPPLVFTFVLAGGRTEVVRVDTAGFTFQGRVYPKKGLMDLFGLKGVP